VTETSCNIASHLPAMAASQPDKAALVAVSGRTPEGRAQYSQFSFSELNLASDSYARGLERIGISRGVRTVLMVRPSLEFFALVFALFKVGAVPVLIDPAIGLKKLRQCLREVEPEAFIGLSIAHVARLLMGSALRSVRIKVTVGARWFWGGHRLRDLKDEDGPAFEMAGTDPDEMAAILFTSGSTGIPKGAVYSHGMFSAQVDMLRAIYRFGNDEIDLPTFPLFALFDPALGMTAVLPEMDFAKPGTADPAKLVEAITDHGCTNMFGSPALLRNLGAYGVAQGLQLPSLRRVLSAGAPVPHSVLRDVCSLLGDGAQVFTPYGATESLPVCNIGSDEVLGETAAATAAGKGICVGRPVDGITVRIIGVSDAAIEAWSDELLVEDGSIGEITVQGPVVSASYWARPVQTAAAKIRRSDGAIVHRMGDVGWVDGEGRLWMCGRKSHRLETAQGPLFTIPIERFFDCHAAGARTALVGTGARGQQRPLLLVEEAGLAGDVNGEQVLAALRALAGEHDVVRSVTDFALYPGRFPVDIRHNAKINREELTGWAQRRST
jgi:acyl-CoA synthetase (AMP-forming)/AMP-acid ligase II